MKIQRSAEHHAMPWANGRGTSDEIASDRNVSGEWSWRIAIAPIIEDGPFSRMPCVDRKLLLVEGSGLQLTIDGKKVICRQGGVVAFRGEAQTNATLLNGPVADLGLMVHRKKASGNLWFVDTIGEIMNANAVVAIGGFAHLDIDGQTVVLEPRDACLDLLAHQIRLLHGEIAAIRHTSVST